VADLEPVATLLLDGTVLVVGGWTLMVPNPTPRNAALYDPAAGTWSATGDAGTGGWFSTLTSLSSGRALMAGGANFIDGSPNYTTQAEAELYDPDAGCWEVTASMSTSRMQHTAALLADGRVLAVGGLSQFGALPLASAEVYAEPESIGPCVTVADAGVQDAGNVDDAGVDAGTSPADAEASDGGAEPRIPPTGPGCACNSFSADMVPLLGLPVLLSFRRKRRGALNAGSPSSSSPETPPRCGRPPSP
jgi:hypothetical protein